MASLLGVMLVVGGGCPDEAVDDDTATDDDTGDDDVHEPGCITVNGEVPGFAHLQDAIDHAVDGDVISVCPGTYAGSIVVEESLILVGEDAATTIIEGAVNEMSVTIRDTTDVSISGFTVLGTRNAVVVEGCERVTLQDLVISDSGQYGLQFDQSEVTVSRCTIDGHPFAGLSAAASTIAVEDCTFTDNIGYGLRLSASDALVTDSTFDNVTVPADTDDQDGTCVLVEDGGELTVDDTDMSGCERVGVYALASTVTVAGSSVTGGANGLIAFGPGGAATFTDNAIDEVPLFGVLVAAMDATVIGNTLSVKDPGDNTFGIAVGSDDGVFEVTDNHVSGYGRCGIWVQYPYADPAPVGGSATVTGNTVSGVDLYGVIATDLDEATVSLNTVESIRWGGSLYQGSYSDGFGVSLWRIEQLTLSDNVIRDVDVVGLFLDDTSFTSDDDQITETWLWGIYAQNGSGTFTELRLADSAIYGADVRTADVDFSSCTFDGVDSGIPPDLWEDPEPYEYPGYALSYTDSQGNVVDTTFTDTDYMHLILDQTDLTMQGCLLQGRSTYGIYASYLYGEITDTTIEDAETGVYLMSLDAESQIGDLTIEGNTFSSVGDGIQSYYVAGRLEILDNVFELTDDVGGYLGDGYGVYVADYQADEAVVELVDNRFADTANSAIYLYGVDLGASAGNQVDGVDNARPAVVLDGCTGVLDALDVAGSTGRGVEVRSSDVDLPDLVVNGSQDHSLFVTGSILDLANGALTDGRASGIRLEGVVGGTLLDNTITDHDEYGISCGAATVLLDDCVNTMSGNVLGDFLEESGCVLGCAIH